MAKSGGYQNRDWEIIDYQNYYLKDVILPFRGPQPKSLEKNQYFVCIGAAQTYGCFCEKPYPKLLEEKLNIPVLNLGRAGAGPSYFLNEKPLLSYINQSKFVVIQVMSGRSEDNSVFRSGGRAQLTRLSDNVTTSATKAYRHLLKHNDKKFVQKIVAETRQNWIDNYLKLFKAIKVPKILFWFSVRSPNYQESYQNVDKLLGEFPHLVNARMVDELKKHTDHYVQCISNRGKPQLMINRFTGEPTTVEPLVNDKSSYLYNRYYPSPEMHIDAAKCLEKICKQADYYSQKTVTSQEKEKNKIDKDLNNIEAKKLLKDLSFLFKPEIIFIDIGAKTGEYVWEVNKILKRGIIYAIEPNPTKFKKLKETCSNSRLLNNNSIHILLATISDQNSHVDSNKNVLSTESGDFTPINFYTLDYLFRAIRPDLVMISTGEDALKVLKGSTEILKQGKAQFLVKYNKDCSSEIKKTNEDLYKFMNSFGYSRKYFDNQVLFLHPQKSRIYDLKSRLRKILPQSFQDSIKAYLEKISLR